ncbi:polyamine ABC transporter substrate-binding protein [Stutzerimonas stutzeri]|uniref:Extracellular solute-binding protein n=1 Tax=Stutzerimonas stutzeri TaxID=316 RepID=A0A6I6LT08_STUST|nr:spermidine/putrescine ABC transporter substrate-binding protein [Stutzerimonas stutzeri]QGZ29451.1 extracellular solute-binding protein [Stutzerimonas stutzeri]
MNNKKLGSSYGRRLVAATLVSASLLFPSTVVRATQSLTLLNWEHYLSDAVIQRWEAETGVAIQQIYFDSGDKRDEVLATPDHQIDLVLTALVSAYRFGSRSLLEPINEAALPNLRHVSQHWRDRCGSYSIPYLWGTLGIAYRADRIDEPPQSWADLLLPTRGDEPHIIMMEDHEDILAAPLIYQQRSINSSDNDELKAAFELLRAQASAVLTYEYAITSLGRQRYLDQAVMALAYSGDQHVLNQAPGVDGAPWRYAVPEEGTLLWVDCLSIPTNTPNKALAYRFLDFISDPRIAALNAAELGVATPNAAARALLPEAMRQDPTIYPPEDILARSQSFEPLPPHATQTRRRIISALINAHDAR